MSRSFSIKGQSDGKRPQTPEMLDAHAVADYIHLMSAELREMAGHPTLRVLHALLGLVSQEAGAITRQLEENPRPVRWPPPVEGS